MTIGYEPIIDTLVLVPGQDFLHDIFPPFGETVPSGTTGSLTFYDPTGTLLATWDANVSSASISWNVSSTLSDTIPTPANFRIYVHFQDGTDFCWYRGPVAHQG